MKVIIDLIEDIREEIANQENFTMHAMLLKENPDDGDNLLYAGEASISSFSIDDSDKKLVLSVDNNVEALQIGELIPHLLILSTPSMMYQIVMNVNTQYPELDIIGFGKTIEEKKYILFIKL